ncbi:MAG: DNA polymerase Y family protein [Burkholderiales bacterium]|nr:DNA polymerase Y family protein [Burkholderiales bacterium]
MQWIAISLPQLPLEILGAPTPEPCAVAQDGRILVCDARAAARGVAPGHTLAAAGALAPNLAVRARDPAGETEALLALAGWAAQFTPSVALELASAQPARFAGVPFFSALSLEVSASLRLFGGLAPILAALRQGLDAMGFTACIACAPTAKSAIWLARAGRETALDSARLAAGLEDLPVRLLDCDADTLAALAAIGAETIGDLERLPRDGVARRFGRGLLEEIDRALGRRPDPRTFFTPPPRFHARLELAAEVSQAEMLVFAARRLVVQLAGFLAARAGGVRRLVLRLFHRDAPATEVAIGLVAPSRDAEHFTRLARERLATVGLRAPVRAITLAAADIEPLAGEPRALFGGAVGGAADDWAQLVERLRARLGAAAVHGVAAVPDHRPERASRRSEPARGQPAPARRQSSAAAPREGYAAGPPRCIPGAPRPFWLLPQPRPLAEIDSVPHHGGPLALLAGPERIESGWWDGDDVARDYFIAQTPDRALVWIFRPRPSGPDGVNWYLHGLFA